MKKVLLYILYFLSVYSVFSKTDDFELAYQNIIVDSNISAPVWLLENESIYPIQIIRIGDFIKTINDLFVSDSYYHVLLSRIVQNYKKDGNLERFKASLYDVLRCKKGRQILSGFFNKKIFYSYEKVKKKIKEIISYFQSIGFLDVKVRAHITKNKNKKVVYVEYFVQTGTCYTIGDVHFLCDAKQLLRLVKNSYVFSFVRPLKRVFYEEIKKERILLLKFLENKDYWNISLEQIKFNLCKDKIKKTVDIFIRILADQKIKPQKVKYDNITLNLLYKNENHISTIAGNKFIKPRILQKIIKIKTGDYYSPQQEEDFYNYFHKSNIFDFVSFKKNIHDNQIDASLLLSFNPKISTSINPNFLLSSENFKFFTDMSVKVLNLCHMLDVLDINISINCVIYDFKQGKKLKDFVFSINPLFYYPFSYVFHTPNILTTVGCVANLYPIDNSQKQRIRYFVQILNLQYQTSFSNIFFVSTKLVPIEIVKYKDDEENFINPNIGFTFKLEYPKFFFTKVDLETGINKQETYNPYFKTVLEASPTIHISRYMYTSVRGMFGIILRGAPEIPENILFKIGGNTTLRGWEEGAVGPGNALVFKDQDRLGDMFILFNLENIYKISKYCSINCFFLDVGNIFKFVKLYFDDYWWGVDEVAFQRENFWKKLFADAGFGIRFNWNFFVIRFDIAFVIYDPTKNDVLWKRYLPLTPNFVFTCGLPFGNVV